MERRGASSAFRLRELRSLSRHDMLSVLKKLRDDPSILANTKITKTALEKDLHSLFDLASAPTREYKLSEDDGFFRLESLNPALLVQLVTNEASNLAEHYLKTHSRTPCSRENPWHLIVGFDEFNPGNATAGTNSKKTMCVYFNFMELGIDALSKAASWFCSLVLSCRMESEIAGRWTEVFVIILKSASLVLLA